MGYRWPTARLPSRGSGPRSSSTTRKGGCASSLRTQLAGQRGVLVISQACSRRLSGGRTFVRRPDTSGRRPDARSLLRSRAWTSPATMPPRRHSPHARLRVDVGRVGARYRDGSRRDVWDGEVQVFDLMVTQRPPAGTHGATRPKDRTGASSQCFGSDSSLTQPRRCAHRCRRGPVAPVHEATHDCSRRARESNPTGAPTPGLQDVKPLQRPLADRPPGRPPISWAAVATSGLVPADPTPTPQDEEQRAHVSTVSRHRPDHLLAAYGAA